MTELEILRLVRFGIETLQMYRQGQLSEDELNQRWEDMRSEILDANELWERAGQRSQ